MAPRDGSSKMFKDKQMEYRRRKEEKEKDRLKYLRRKVKLRTATKEDKKELKVLEKKA